MQYGKIVSGISITILICIILGMIIISILMSYQMFDNIKKIKSSISQPANNNMSYIPPNMFHPYTQ